MKKLLALLVFCLAFTPPIVRAVDWVRVTGNNQVITYIDVDSIKMSNGKVYFWYLNDFTPHIPDSPDTLSSKNFTSITDCDLLSYQRLTTTFFSEHLGNGNVTATFEEKDPVSYAIPESIMGHIVEWVCDFIKR